MDITVYLPDEIGQRAKEAGLNLSGLLRNIVTAELRHREVLDRTLAGASREIQLEVVDEEGFSYLACFTGTEIASGRGYTLGSVERVAGPYSLYLAEDGRVVLYVDDDMRYEVLDEPAEFRPDDDREYIKAMRALGLKAVVDL